MKTQTRHIYREGPVSEIGGKAYNLLRLEKMGFRVPRWMVIPQQILNEQIPAEAVESQDWATLRYYIHHICLPQDVLDQMAEFVRNSPDQNTWYAARSSAVDEDGASHSFAGQFESFLYVRADQLESYVKKVWQSAFSDRVATYRKEHNLPMQPGIAVIIQEMVDAEIAGVGFGIDPRNGDQKTKIISSVYGLGEGIVSGALDADNFIVRGNVVENQIVRKEYAFVHHPHGSGLTQKSIAPKLQELPSLNPGQVLEIASVLDRLEKETGRPQDIEFAWKNETLFLLQTRPVTTAIYDPQPSGKRTVWDNSNIIESYPGVTTPLTFSFIIKMYEAVYQQLALLLGISPQEIEDHKETFANMLGLLNGRVYYNLKSWYQLLSLLPGYSLNAGFMEKMMGVKEKFELEEKPRISKTRAWLRIAGSVVKMIRSLAKLPADRKKFQAFLDEVIAEYHAIDFDQCGVEELRDLYLRFEHILVKEWKAPLVNDFFAMIYFGTLEKLIRNWNIGHNPNLHNDLHCGSQDIISTEPIRQLFSLTASISRNPLTHQYFTEETPENIWEGLQTGKFPEIRSGIDLYLDRFGERCVGELKLETISYRQDPVILISIVKSYVEEGITSHTSQENIEEKIRYEGEKTVRESLRGKWFRMGIFSYVLRMSRSMVSSRENLRYERTRGFGVVRSIFSAIGRKFHGLGMIDHPRDIFYLTKEEIFHYINGTSVSTSLQETIQLRKDEYSAYQEMDQPAERITTYGAVYHQNEFYPEKANHILVGDLRGIGCCPGVVRGRVRIVRHPHEVKSLSGDILVTSSTDPGWVTLFPSASAIIVERGSLLSHSAIVSRELGIPCIVGVAGLLTTLRTGDLIEMDGSTGNIQIIEHHDQATP